ncbi:MAG: cell division protein FtsQ [Bacteroidota bacterium]
MAKRKTKAIPFAERAITAVRSYGWVVMALVLCLLAVSAIGKREASHVETVAPIILPLPDGEALVTEDELIDLLAASFTKPLDELTLTDIDVRRVEEILEGQAFVADADAFVDDDLQLNILITQRIPLLRVMAENGQNYYLDEDGVRMPTSDTHTARVPVASGNLVLWQEDFMEYPDHQLYQIVELAHYLRKDNFLSALVEQVYVKTNGELVLAPKVGDQVIHLGRYQTERTQERLQRLKTFYREGLPYEGWRKYRSFDLRYADQVVAKKR